jgi:hypothetical protein
MTAQTFKATVLPLFAADRDPECKKKRISNIEQGMLNAEAMRQGRKPHHSTFRIRYSIFLQGSWQDCCY